MIESRRTRVSVSTLVCLSLAFFLGAGGFAFSQESASALNPEKRKELLAAAASSGFSVKALAYTRTLKDANQSLAILDELSAAAVQPADRLALLREKASLCELLGSWKQASSAWSAASAIAADSTVANECLLSAAVCLLNTGDAAGTIALTDSAEYSRLDRPAATRFMLVAAWAEYMRGNSLKASVLANPAIASDNKYLRFQGLLLMQGASAGSERDGFSKQLQAMLKDQPELGDAFAPYMLNDLSTYTRIAALVEAQKPASVEKPQPPMPPASDSAETENPKYYQVGAFISEENAKAMVGRLKAAGIAALTATKKSGSGSLYVVYVESGSDPARLVLKLKDIGLEAWPLSSAP